ncbi:hypothetical protein CesoFtcFv8_000550 [Champsocephalus esox]|uniref:Uncharacterized protein n=1 Tax=Champsocephalus esox TaxID=159716 RepID=A0AAN8DBW7_9TELE|nr:hypothetical protein CesoFtcFv8_000550 [Champsocephalus esox]
MATRSSVSSFSWSHMASASTHYYGGTETYSYKGRNPDGSLGWTFATG